MKLHIPAVAVSAACAILLGLALSSLTLATSGPVLVVIAGVERRRRSRQSAARLAERTVLLTVDHMVGGLRSGLSLRQACTAGGFGSGPLAPMIGAVGQGAPLAQAAGRCASAVTVGPAAGSVRLVAVTLTALAENGGPAIPALQRLRHALAGAEHGRRRADAESAQASASAGLLIAAPALFASAIAGIDSATAHLYMYEGIGAGCVLAAVVLSCCGWWWMQHAIERTLRSAL